MSDRDLTPKDYGPTKSVPIVELVCMCICCGKETGKTINLKATLIDEKLLKRSNKVREGLCDDCKILNDAGHTIFVTDTRGVILDLEANDKIEDEYRGKVIKIPEDKMDEIMGKKG